VLVACMLGLQFSEKKRERAIFLFFFFCFTVCFVLYGGHFKTLLGVRDAGLCFAYIALEGFVCLLILLKSFMYNSQPSVSNFVTTEMLLFRLWEVVFGKMWRVGLTIVAA